MEKKLVEGINYGNYITVIPFYVFIQCFNSTKDQNILKKYHDDFLSKEFKSSDQFKEFYEEAIKSYIKNSICNIQIINNQIELSLISFYKLMIHYAFESRTDGINYNYEDKYVEIVNEIIKDNRITSEEYLNKSLLKAIKEMFIVIDRNENPANITHPINPYELGIRNAFTKNTKINKLLGKTSSQVMKKEDYITYAEKAKKVFYRCMSQIMKNNKSFSIFDFENINYDKYLFIINYYKMEELKTEFVPENAIYSILTYCNYIISNDIDTKELYLYYKDYDINKRKKITFDDLLKMVQEYLKNHPNLNFEIIEPNYFDNWEDQHIEEFLDLYTDDSDKNFEVIDPEYIFLKGKTNTTSTKREKNFESIQDEDNEPVPIVIPPVEKDDIDYLIRKKRFYDTNREKIHTPLLGKNKFAGYVANILNNGYVIFEKYNIKNGCISSKSGAAYIMTIENFHSLSHKSIQDLRKLTNDPTSNTDIDYVCHKGNWEEKIQKYVDKQTSITKELIDLVVVDSADTKLTKKPTQIKKIYKKPLN